MTASIAPYLALALAAAMPGFGSRVDRFGDPLPDGALLRLGTIRYRSGGYVTHAALSPDGKLLATASPAGITLFDLATGKPRHLRQANQTSRLDFNGCSLAFSPDGKQLIHTTNQGNLCFWDWARNKRLRFVGDGVEPVKAEQIHLPTDVPRVGRSNIQKFWFPPHGKHVVAGTHDRFVVYIDPSNGKVVRFFRVGGDLSSVSSNGKLLSVVELHRSEVILSDDSGIEQRRVAHPGFIVLATLCQGGKRLVTVNNNAEIKIWDASTSTELRTIAGPPIRSAMRSICAVSITPDGRTLLAGTRGGDILRWDLRTGAERPRLIGHKETTANLLYTPDGQTLISVSWSNQILRWNLRTGKAQPPDEGFVWGIAIARSPDGRTIAAGDFCGRLEFWDAGSGKRKRIFSLPAESFTRMRFSPDGKYLALGCLDGRMRIWDVAKERVTGGFKLPAVDTPGSDGRSWFAAPLTWSPDGRFLVGSLCGNGNGTRMWETASGKQKWFHYREAAAAFAPDGKTLVSAGGMEMELTFQDAATGKVRFVLKERDFVRDLQFSPDGGSLATCYHGGDVQLRDPVSGQVFRTLRGRWPALALSFSPDGRWLAAGGGHDVLLWEVATGAEVLCRTGHEGNVLQVAFGADGRTLLSSSADLTALLWTLRPSAEPGRKRPLETLWSDLAAEPATAYRAQWEMSDDPNSACNFLRRKIPPVQVDVSERRVQALLRDLDHDDFRKREAASRTLAAMGAAVRDRLRRALNDAPSAEVRLRLLRLLDGRKRVPNAEDLRRQRAVQVIELCGTAEAHRLLRDWAGGTAGFPLTEQAKAARQRLER